MTERNNNSTPVKRRLIGTVRSFLLISVFRS